MSTSTVSISPTAFASAIADLPLENVYAKASELQNSISHLLDSNIQMKPFADEGDEICREAIHENDDVVRRMEERIELCKDEVQKRGMTWMGGTSVNSDANNAPIVNGDMHPVNGESATVGRPQRSGRLTDDELRRQIEAQLDQEHEDDDGAGIHL